MDFKAFKAILIIALLGLIFTASASAKPIYAFGVDAYIDSDLVSQVGQKANPGATKAIPIPMGMFSGYFRYSGGLRNPGFVPASNSVQIHFTRGHLSNGHNHLGAWEGINGMAVCNGVYCNWLQAGIVIGQSCFVGAPNNQQYLYVEINYGTVGTTCPTTNGNGYYQGNLGAITNNSTHTVNMYLCGNAAGCTYTDNCNHNITWPTSYHRGAVSVDGCFRTSNVAIDDPNAGQRQIVAPLEDFYGNGNGDYGDALFTNSTNTFSYWESGGGGCGGLDSGNKSWEGCVNAN